MKTWNLLILAALTALVAGCSQKPPKDLIGVWETKRDLGLLTITERLELKSDGLYTLSRVSGGDPTFTGGPVTGGVEKLHAGKFTVKGNTLYLKATTLSTGGRDTSVTGNMSAQSRFQLSGKTLTVQDGSIFMIEKALGTSSAAGEGRPIEGLSGVVTMTKSDVSAKGSAE